MNLRPRVSFFASAVVATVFAFVIPPAVVAPLACSSSASCEPTTFGLQSSRALVIRALTSGALFQSSCVTTRFDVISSQADLDALYVSLSVDTSADAGKFVDFATERVVVREGSADEGISWGVDANGVGVFGILSCGSTNRQPTCATVVVAVDALIVRAETRTCDPVGCGDPQRAPIATL